MALIVKELIVRGIVSDDNSLSEQSSLNKEELQEYLEQLKKDIEKECLEKVLQKLESRTIR